MQVTTAPFLKRTLFNWGLSRKLHFMRQGRKQAEVSTCVYVCVCDRVEIIYSCVCACPPCSISFSSL